MKKIVCCLISMQFIGSLLALPERRALSRGLAKVSAKNQNRFSCGAGSSSSSDCTSSSDNGCSACCPTPIFQVDFNFRSGGDIAGDEMRVRQTGFLLLTAAGIYCLAEDVTGSILIQAGSITIDMNGHIINGFGANDGIIITNTNAVPMIDVRIKNGTLQGTAVSTRASGTGNGINLDGGDSSAFLGSITLEDLVIDSWQNGIAATTTDGITINRVSCTNNSNDGMQLGISSFGCSNVAIADCLCEFNGNFSGAKPASGSNGIELFDTVVTRIERTLLNHNASNGLFVTSSVALIQNVECVGCATQGNNGYGFSAANNNLVKSQGMSFRDCISDSNALSGFHAGIGTRYLEYINCSSTNNLDEGFLAQNSIALVYENCNAIGNVLQGFVCNDSQDIQYLNCTATANAGEGFSMASSDVGFSSTSRDIIMNNCSSIHNHCHGFHAFNVIGGLTITSCQAQANSGEETAGFLMEGPFNFAIIRDCTSQFNDIGFASSSVAFPVPGTNNYYANVACNNTMFNYVDVDVATIANQNCALAFQNIDCDFSC